MAGIDEMTDTPIGMVMSKSIEGRNGTGKPFTAIVKCWNSGRDELDIYVNWGEYLRFLTSANMLFRFDKDKMFEVKVKPSTNGMATMVQNERDLTKLLYNLESKNIMRVKVSNYREVSPPIAVFSLTGFVNAFKKVCEPWIKSKTSKN